MLPEVSSTKTMSMPSVRTWVCLRPVWGRAMARISSPMVRILKPSTNFRSTIRRDGFRRFRVSTLEYFTAARLPRRRASQGSTHQATTQSMNSGTRIHRSHWSAR